MLPDDERFLNLDEEKFRSVFDSSNVGKSITLPNGEIHINKAFCDMLGYSREELLHKR
jgi:PAS domain S-box-containing protein